MSMNYFIFLTHESAACNNGVHPQLVVNEDVESFLSLIVLASR
jgi:hypothetical protein